MLPGPPHSLHPAMPQAVGGPAPARSLALRCKHVKVTRGCVRATMGAAIGCLSKGHLRLSLHASTYVPTRLMLMRASHTALHYPEAVTLGQNGRQMLLDRAFL